MATKDVMSEPDVSSSVSEANNISADQERLTPETGEVTKARQCVGGDKKMTELIIKDMQLYHEVVDRYSFKTEQ